MDRQFLEEYENRENDEYSKFHKHLMKGDLSPDYFYPSLSRFPKMKNPIFRACQHQFNLGEPAILWPQIPLAGSLLVVLHPVRKDFFKEHHGFDVEDLPKLVDFAKETGRIQFQLGSSPMSYEGLDYFDPVFIELCPPLAKMIQAEDFFSDEERRRHKTEFIEVYRLKLGPLYTSELRKQGLTKEAIAESAGGLYGTYLTLRVLGKHDLAEKMLALMVDDPRLAYTMLVVYGEFLAKSIQDTLCASINIDLPLISLSAECLGQEDRATLLSSVELPCEIGAFLMRKLAPYPESFESMKYLVDRYKQEELYKVMKALNKAVISKSPPDFVNKKASDVGEILDSVWKDAGRIRREINQVDFAVSMILGVIGPVVGYMGAGIPGLLSALGFSVLEKNVDFFGGVGKRVIGKLRPNFLVNIYDFQTKHQIE